MRDFDYGKLREIKWDGEILGLVAQIHEYKGKQALYLKQKPATLEKLVEVAKIQSTESSNKIEGIITTASRIKQLCEQKTTMRATNISRLRFPISCSCIRCCTAILKEV